MYNGFIDELSQSDSFLVLTHARPDGDAIGSQIAMTHLLRRMGKKAVAAAADETPRNLAWLDTGRTIEIYDGSPSQIVRFGSTDAVVIVDANHTSRLGELSDLAERHTGRVFIVDHHPNPADGYDGYAVDTSAASTGELVYALFDSVNVDWIDERVAVCLYTAIMTDTGSFRYGNVGPELLGVTADLFRRGSFTAEEVYRRVYKTRSLEGQRLLGESLRTLAVSAGGRLGYMIVTRRMFDQTGSSSEDVESFTDFILSIEGVEVAILFMEVGPGVKMSFRSQGEIPINAVAEDLGGGGHRNAAGAYVRGEIGSVLKRVVSKTTSAIAGPPSMTI